MGDVIAVSTNKGGVLKTSLTTNIAGVLAQRGEKILIIDSDNQGNAALSFGLNPDSYENSLYDVLVEDGNIEDIIIEAHPGIDIAISNDDMVHFELDVLTNVDQFPNLFHLLKLKIDNIKHEYDYILIDTPPNLGLTTGNVLSAANKILIPFQPENYSMRSLVKILTTVSDFKNKHNTNLEILGIVATLIDSRTTLHSEVLQLCRKYALENDLKVFDTVIPRTVRFANSVAYMGLPATLTDKRNNLVESYFELVKEMNI